MPLTDTMKEEILEAAEDSPRLRKDLELLRLAFFLDTDYIKLQALKNRFAGKFRIPDDSNETIESKPEKKEAPKLNFKKIIDKLNIFKE